MCVGYTPCYMDLQFKPFDNRMRMTCPHIHEARHKSLHYPMATTVSRILPEDNQASSTNPTINCAAPQLQPTGIPSISP